MMGMNDTPYYVSFFMWEVCYGLLLFVAGLILGAIFGAILKAGKTPGAIPMDPPDCSAPCDCNDSSTWPKADGQDYTQQPYGCWNPPLKKKKQNISGAYVSPLSGRVENKFQNRFVFFRSNFISDFGSLRFGMSDLENPQNLLFCFKIHQIVDFCSTKIVILF